jgi:hypothetical protein
MRLVNTFVRLAVPLALLATALFGAGWKWEHLPH